MPGTRNPNATLCHSEHSEESREERKEILRFALNDKLIVNCQWLIVMRGTRRIMYLENNHGPFISAFVHGPRAMCRRSSEQGEREIRAFNEERECRIGFSSLNLDYYPML